MEWYREILDAVAGRYRSVGRRVIEGKGTSRAWSVFEDEFFRMVMAVDYVSAARLRGLPTDLPAGMESFDPEALVDMFPWYRQHVGIVIDHLEEQVKFVRSVEESHYETRKAMTTPEVVEQRIQMIYRNTVGEVRQSAEQVQLSIPEVGRMFPFSEYRTRDDARVRPTHTLMHGFAAVRTWEGWSVVRPKNGYNCRCYLRHVNWIEAISKGWAEDIGKISERVIWPNSGAKVNYENRVFPDPGWQGPKFVAAA